jgi:hypothetical protein
MPMSRLDDYLRTSSDRSQITRERPLSGPGSRERKLGCESPKVVSAARSGAAALIDSYEAEPYSNASSLETLEELCGEWDQITLVAS